jgi:hypothetical protein
MNVGFEQRHANFAQGGFHVLRCQFSFAAEVLENSLEFFREGIEHLLKIVREPSQSPGAPRVFGNLARKSPWLKLPHKNRIERGPAL